MAFDENDKYFFEHWEKHLEAMSLLNKQNYKKSAETLLYACFDALANCWAKSIKSTIKFKTDARRFGEFLSECSGQPDIFQKICAPDLWHRAEKLEVQMTQGKSRFVFTPDQINRIKFCANRSKQGNNALREPTESFIQNRACRLIAQDPTMDDILQHELKDIALISEINANKKNKTYSGKEWLLNSRMGEMAYRVYRCSWIHEGRIGTEGHGFRDHWNKPNYLSVRNSSSVSLDFPLDFMLQVFKNCINQFHLQAKSLNVNPAPPPNKPFQLLDLEHLNKIHIK